MMPQAQTRGGWRSDASLRRYGKETRLLAELAKVPATTLQFGLAVQEHLSAVVSGNLAAAGIVLPPLQPMALVVLVELRLRLLHISTRTSKAYL